MKGAVSNDNQQVIFVTVPNYGNLDSFMSATKKVQIVVDKKKELNEVLKEVKTKHPHFISFFWRGLQITKQ